VANRLLPLTAVDATASRSVRADGDPPAWHHVDDIASALADVVRSVKHRHRFTGVVAPVEWHARIEDVLSAAGFVAVDHVHELGHDDVPVFTPEAVKGLEFDGVVVVNPHEILGDTPRGARLLYVAMTRAVQELAFVTTGDAPAVIAPGE
jgi:DNA helicase IV